jgi:predicted ATPase
MREKIMAFIRKTTFIASSGIVGAIACFVSNPYKSHQDFENQKVTTLASKKISDTHSIGKETVSKLPKVAVVLDRMQDGQLKDRSSCVSACFSASMYAITGGPSSGKTSIIKELEKRGECVVHEAAADWITSKIKAGVLEPWKENDFVLNIFKLHLERERPYLSFDGRVFIDRGIFDVYAFVMNYGLAGTQALVYINEVLNQIGFNQRYKAVFFVLPYETKEFSPLQTEVRRENAQEAAKQEAAIYAIYCKHNNFIVVPGGLSPQERADFILEKIRQMDSAVSVPSNLLKST